MARTRNRPLVRHAISPLHATGYAVVTGIAGPALLWTMTNPTTALLGAALCLHADAAPTPDAHVRLGGDAGLSWASRLFQQAVGRLVASSWPLVAALEPADEPVGVGHLSEWARETKAAFLRDLEAGNASDWTVVMGNEAGDLDSVRCSPSVSEATDAESASSSHRPCSGPST